MPPWEQMAEALWLSTQKALGKGSCCGLRWGTGAPMGSETGFARGLQRSSTPGVGWPRESPAPPQDVTPSVATH